MKFKTITLSLLAFTTLAIAATVTIDSTPDTLDKTPNCSLGLKKMNNDSEIKRYYSNGVFTDGNFYGCFANPKQFQVKIYSISLVDANGNETSLYNPTTPTYVDIINNRFNPVKDISSLTDGTTYTKVKMVVDSNYKIMIDEQVPRGGATTSRVITHGDTSNPSSVGASAPAHSSWVTPLTNQGVTGNGSGNVRAFFARDASTTATLITFLHNGFMMGGQGISLSNVGFKVYRGSVEQYKDFVHNCYFDWNDTNKTCNPSSSLTTDSSQPSFYPMTADWDLSSSTGTITHITHAINQDASGNPLDFFGGPDQNVQWEQQANVKAGRATITMTLKTPFTYDASKGAIMRWKWLTNKLFFMGIWTNDLGAQDTVSFIGLGPYGFDLSINAVTKKTSGFSDTTPITGTTAIN